MADATPADVLAQMAAQTAAMNKLTNSWQAYMDQQRRYDNGTADEVITSPAGQPDPGYYPVIDPAGLVTWRPSVKRQIAEANTLSLRSVQLNLTTGFLASEGVTVTDNSYTFRASDSGRTYYMAGKSLSAGITLTLPNGLPTGWTCNIIQLGSGQIRFVAATGASFLRRNNFDAIAGQYGIANVTCLTRVSGTNSTYDIFGDLKVAS